MADEKVEMTKTEQVTEMVTDQQHSETPTEKVEVSKAEFEKMQAALKEANKEAAARRKRTHAGRAVDWPGPAPAVWQAHRRGGGGPPEHHCARPVSGNH